MFLCSKKIIAPYKALLNEIETNKTSLELKWTKNRNILLLNNEAKFQEQDLVFFNRFKLSEKKWIVLKVIMPK